MSTEDTIHAGLVEALLGSDAQKAAFIQGMETEHAAILDIVESLAVSPRALSPAVRITLEALAETLRAPNPFIEMIRATMAQAGGER